MKKIQVVLVLLLVIYLPGSTSACSTKEDSLSKSIEQRVQKLMRREHLPGFVITVVDDQKVIYQDAFGFADLENNIRTTTGTVFRLWSVSKLFTALEIFREVEEGLIELDDPLDYYLPEFSIRNRSETKADLSIRSILAHRSGLPRNECLQLTPEDTASQWLYKFEKAVSECFMAFPEGSRYHYSNLGYDLLGRVIEKNRQEGFGPYMKKHMFDELGMNHSTFSSGDLGESALLAGGYEFYKGEFFPVLRPDIKSLPSGNLYSTVEDLSIFLNSVFSQNIFSSEKTMPLMFEDHFSTAEDPETMGLGWKTTSLNGTDLLVYHDGGPSDGTGALVALLPHRKLGIALMGNGTSLSGGISLPFAMEIFDELIDTGNEGNLSMESRTGPHNKRYIAPENPVTSLEDCEGNYALFGQLMEVRAKGRKLKAKFGGLGLELLPDGRQSFRVTHWMKKIGLTRIFKPPIDFDKIHISFCDCNSPDGRGMIINFDNISFEFGPRYPDEAVTPGNWTELCGEYRMAHRQADNTPGAFTGQNYAISVENNALVMSGVFGPVVPVDDHYLEIMSGPFAGETIEYDSRSGNLIHQNAFFIPETNKNFTP